MILTAVNATSIYRPVKAAGAGATSGIHLISRLFLVVVVVVLLMVTDSPLSWLTILFHRPSKEKEKEEEDESYSTPSHRWQLQ